MDDNKLLEELKATIREGHSADSKLTITWAAVITILVILFSALFAGYVTNNIRISKLEVDFKYTIETIATLKQDQKQALELLTEIRFDQRRREKKEKD